MSLPRYPEYKESGVTWLGELPAHWSFSPLKRHFRLVTDRATTKRRAVALENIEGWSGRYIETEGEFQGDGTSFEPGDLLFGKLRPYLAKVFLADFPGEAVGDFHVLRPSRNLCPRFAQYQMLQREFISVVDGSTFGSKMPRAGWEALGGMPFVVPDVSEQEQIGSFLDRETTKIDALIAEQEKLLALLAEKRKATISHAVTRGLDPNAPMKDSGIPWLGEVPAHWETVRLRHLARLNPSKTEVEDDGDPDVSFLPMEAIGEDGSIRVDQERPLSQLQNGYSYFRNGDVVVAKITPCFENGKGALISDLPRGYGFGTTELIVVRSVGCLRPAFLSLVLSSSLFRKLAEGAMYGAGGQKRVPDEFVREFTVCVPPVEEQDAIWEEAAKQTALLRSLELQSIAAIALLKERRSALISAAVTGQIDVRGEVEPETA